MSSSLHQEAAAAICSALYQATEELLGKNLGFDGWCKMQEAVAKKEIPQFWPGADSERIERVAERLPPVNYLRPSPFDEEWVLKVLTDIFPNGRGDTPEKTIDPIGGGGRQARGGVTKSRRNVCKVAATRV